MKYISTRGSHSEGVSSAYAIKTGLAADGGLFMPESIPQINFEFIKELSALSYPERATKVLSLFLSDYGYDELTEDATKAYSADKFIPSPAPITQLSQDKFMLELWHGPTSAFKDMALQIMPRLLSRALVKTGEKNTALILVATSGDTGKAALEGHKDVDKVKIMVFYPVDGVSKVQKLQMATQTGNNVNVCAIRGNFDDAQTGVKKIFSDPEAKAKLLENGYVLSSANSINWGRLAPQIVYYFHAYCELLKAGEIALGDKINVCVPTGNFGNIFAAYLAKLMGLPIDKMVCASNSNNVLTDFISTGVYDRNRKFHLTMSPSMDILISSNLERLLYFTAGTEETRDCMKKLSECGRYEVSEGVKAAIKENFVGYCADEEETARALRACYNNDGYLADTHTSVALACADEYLADTKDAKKMVVVSTASPYKFAADVYKSITGEEAADGTGALDQLEALSGMEISYPLKDLDKRTVNFTTVVDANEMLDEVYKFM